MTTKSARTTALLIAFTTLASAALAQEPSAEPRKDAPPTYAVFDFVGESALGPKLADSLRLKLNRLLKVAGRGAVLSKIEMDDLSPQWPGDGLTADPPQLSGMLRSAAATVGVWGRVEKTDRDTVKLTVRVLDLAKDPTRLAFESTYRGGGPQFARQVIHPLAERLTGLKIKKPREAGSIPEPAQLGPPLTANADFESGSGYQPTGWDPVDGLTSFWIDDPLGERGKVIKMDTRVSQEQASAWWQRIHDGADPADAPPPRFTNPPHYSAVAGLHGVHFFSRYYKIKPKMRYRILADYRSTKARCNLKVFVKGYAEFKQPQYPDKTQRREVWRTYLACRGEPGRWHHNSEVFEPSPRARWIRVIPYAYWPADEYYWDNVRVVEEPKP